MLSKKLVVLTAALAFSVITALPAGAGTVATGTAVRHSVYRPLSISNIKDEHLRPLPAGSGPVRVSTAMEPRVGVTGVRTGSRMAPAAAFSTTTGSNSQGFLTRPYTTWHNITSVFDHTNPDYTQDGTVVEFDGSTGNRSYGVDPSFSLGYAQSPGGSDYLYYDGHNGWDYALNYENVRAAADGIVQLAGSDPYNSCFGQTVTIQHPNGYTTRYAHLSQIYVSSGQPVQRGQIIAQSGNTGCSSGPHLHFGVYITSSWTAIDPWGWSGPGADPWPSDPGNLWLTGYAQYPLPSAPGNVTAIAGNASATVSWTAPAFDGGSGIGTYTVTATPGGASVQVGGGTTSTLVTGLTNGTSYTFAVTAQNSVGANISSASNAITPTAWLGQFRTIAPVRILDTRNGTGGAGGALGPQSSFNLQVVGVNGLPQSWVAAVVVNATVTQPSNAGFITVYPTGGSPSATSTVNFQANQTVANLVTVPVGSGGDISVFNWVGTTHVVLDLVGWFYSNSTTGEGLLHTIAPARLMDTRIAPQHAVIGGQPLIVPVAGHGGVPASGVAAALVNLTITDTRVTSYLTAYASGTTQPNTSNLNFSPLETISNRAIVPVGSDGNIVISNFAGSVDVIVDVVGWFGDSSGAAASTGQFVGLSPARLYDSRTSDGPLTTAATRAFMVAGQSGVPASGVSAVLLNVTVANPQAAGYFSLYADGSPKPPTSDLNFAAGDLRSNFVVAQVGSDGKVDVYNLIGSATAVVDVLGYIN